MFKELFEKENSILTVRINNKNIKYTRSEILEMINDLSLYMGADNLPKWLYFALQSSPYFIMNLGTNSSKKIQKYAKKATELILMDVINGKVKKIKIEGKSPYQSICDTCIDNVKLSIYAEQVK